MSKKYRIRLANDRIVGPFGLAQIGELYKKGHIKGGESFQLFPVGDWKKLKDEPTVQKYLAKVIAQKDSDLTVSNQDATVVRINIASQKKKKKKEEIEEEPVEFTQTNASANKAEEEHKEFKFTKESDDILVDYDELEKKYNEQKKNEVEAEEDKPAEQEDIDKTVVVSRRKLNKKSPPPQVDVDRTVINPKAMEQLRALEEKKKQEEEKKQREEEQRRIAEEKAKEEEVNFDEGTQLFDKNALVKLKHEAKELERELKEKKEEKEVEEAEEEYEIVVEEPEQEKKKIKPIVAFAFIVILWFLMDDDGDKKKQFEPSYVKIEAPITFEVEDAKKATELYKKGLEYYKSGTYLSKVQASALFKKSIEYKFNDNPALGILILTYGEIFNNVSNKSKGAAILFNLIKITRSKVLNDLNIALGTALFYNNNGKPNSAISLIEKYLRVGNPSLKLLSVYLDILIETGNLVKARDVLNKIENYTQLPVEAYSSISKYYTLDERYDKGKETVLTGLKKYPSSVALLLDLAEYKLRDMEFKDYQAILKKVEALNYEGSPEYYARYLEYIGILSAYNKDIPTAAFLFKMALKISDSDRLRSKLASLDIGGGKMATKIILESKAIDLIRKSKKLMKERKWEEAFIEAIAAAELEINYLPANLHLINLQIKRGYYESAINTLEFLKREYPTHPGVNFTLIKALYESNKIEEAQTQVNIISNSKLKQHQLYYSVVGNFYEKSGKSILAIKFLRKSVELNPLRDSDYFLMAQIYGRSRQYRESKQMLNEAITLDPLNIKYKSLYANILFDLEGADTAIGYVQAALEEYKDNPILMGDKATFYYRNGQIAQFKDMKKEIEKLSSNDPGFYEFLLKAAVIEDDVNKIIKYSKALIEVNPGDVETRMTLAQYLLAGGYYSDAISAIEGIVERLSTYPGAYYLMGQVYLQTKEYDKAIKAAEKEVENNPAIYNGYYILGEANRRLGNMPEAVDNLEKAISIEPRNVESLVALGRIKINQRNFDVARELFLRAKKKEPSNPEIRKELGFIYQGVGQSALAIEQFETYLKLWPNAPDRNQIKGHIQALSR